MGNRATSPAVGVGKVVLKMTSGKKITLLDVLHVHEMRKNLVSGSKLTRGGFKAVFEADRLVLSRAGVYVGRGYLNEGLFKLNVQTIVVREPNVVPAIIENNNNPTSAYIVESPNLWHDRL